MTGPEELGSKYHVLLIGIDDYPRGLALRGCVNDIDAIQRILRSKLGVPEGQIQRLASPRRGATHDDAISAQPATLANIRTAFTRITEAAKEGDRVFIYYSGHGTRTKLQHEGQRTTDREALVPVDFDAKPGYALLFDYELNQLLGRLTARTRSVTCILDCCHSAGATRAADDPDALVRYIDLVEDLGWPEALPAPEDMPPSPEHASRGVQTARGDGNVHTVDDCHVVAACMNHESSWEGIGDDGVRNGRFTRAFVRALQGVESSELPKVPWARIWQTMRVEVENQTPAQHLWMAGNPARAVFAGPPVEGDAGIPLRRVGDTYQLEAGSIASVTKSAIVAVYGEQPPYFPPLGTPEDLAARRGLLRVTKAELSSATAEVDGPEWKPHGSERGRLVEPGDTPRLRCVIVPWNDDIAADLRESPLLEAVREGAEVRLARASGRWLITDDLHGPTQETALFELAEAELESARAVLEHYFSYALPLRLARSVGDMGTLKLRVLACPKDVPPEKAQDPDLSEAPAMGSATYDVIPGSRVCFRVHNASMQPLRVTLLNVAASGRVLLLGDQIIEGGKSYVFWSDNGLGKPFAMNVPPHRKQGIDRLIAVGTNQIGKDLSFLKLSRRFLDVILAQRNTMLEHDEQSRDAEAETHGKNVALAEEWTSTQAIILVREKQP